MSAPSDPADSQPDEPAGPVRPMSALAVLAYRAIGMAALGLAIAGAFLPLLPTTIFLIVAAWAFGKSAPKLRARLYAHKRFGPTLKAWDQRGAIPPRAKIAALLGMTISWVVLTLTTHRPWLSAVVGVVLIGCAAYVLTRPSA
ncbi:YbaN family protein [Phenylobacterium sp.]|uniref:YbaN family protein n=1 Tax=Phenylobacterium sp. TaxID=1871053 RepID=UPI0008BE81B3|nr:YbaN family protein [Phenylobacterium sp.]OHB38456.1 MAG: hypothetical protein A2882_15200 [Phenylobacterium sp. RIFCSPHIGHO2_01_FULL_70_10]